jgi:hypothetical protein
MGMIPALWSEKQHCSLLDGYITAEIRYLNLLSIRWW